MKQKPELVTLQNALPEIEIHEEIASGGFKAVYKADIEGRTEALKLVYIPVDPDDESVREENRKRIFREINILNRCQSSNIVKLGSIQPRELTIDKENYVAYSEELIRGDSLRQLIKSDYQPDFNELRTLFLALLTIIKELSSHNIIHRDIKPDNIIKTNDKNRPFVLLDFGIAFQIGGTFLTVHSRHVPGTLYYIAPEMLDPGFRQSLDYRADLYAVGLALYEYASRDNPYARKEEDPFTTLYRIKTAKPKPLRDLCPDLPKSFCDLIDILMKKLPALRPANIDSLIRKVKEIK